MKLGGAKSKDPPKQNAPFRPELLARRGIGRAAAEQDRKRCKSPSQSEGLAQSANRFGSSPHQSKKVILAEARPKVPSSYGPLPRVERSNLAMTLVQYKAVESALYR